MKEAFEYMKEAFEYMKEAFEYMKEAFEYMNEAFEYMKEALSFAILFGEERAGCFALFVFLVSRGCCVALHRGAMGLSAVCDCGIS